MTLSHAILKTGNHAAVKREKENNKISPTLSLVQITLFQLKEDTCSNTKVKLIKIRLFVLIVTQYPKFEALRYKNG